MVQIILKTTRTVELVRPKECFLSKEPEKSNKGLLQIRHKLIQSGIDQLYLSMLFLHLLLNNFHLIFLNLLFYFLIAFFSKMMM